MKKMGVNSVNNSIYTASNTDTTRTVTKDLGKDEFLSLLITQLKNQDPLNPTDNTEYVSQLAQFSSLEQMSNMSAGISSMEALTMTGKTIKATVTDSATGEVSEIQGVVDSVKLKSGKATLMVNGHEVDIGNVTSVYDYSRQDVSNLSSLLGQNCQGYIYDATNLSVMSVEGKVTGIEKGAYEDYAVMDGVKAQVDSILSSDYKTSQSKLDYLNSHIGKEIDIKLTDPGTGKKVPVTAVLEAVEETDGTITVTLNKVKVPVDGIFSVNQQT